MKAIVVDLELTQNGVPKIIEIGAVLVETKSHRVLDVFSKLANPGELPCERITNLTGITVPMIEQAPSLEQVLTEFWKFVEDSNCGKLLITWGQGDVEYLVSESDRCNVKVPYVRSLDLKTMSAFFRESINTKLKGGLKNTLDLFGIPFEGEQHRAFADSYNTAQLLFYLQESIKFTMGVQQQHGPIKVKKFHDDLEKYKHFLVRS